MIGIYENALQREFSREVGLLRTLLRWNAILGPSYEKESFVQGGASEGLWKSASSRENDLDEKRSKNSVAM
jgi:hypothetical protein